MKKIVYTAVIIALTVCTLAVCALTGCKSKKTDYTNYISEKRTNIYLYSNDGLEIKIYISEKETPYSADGIKGEVSSLTEIFVTLPKNYDEVEVKAGNVEGEMSYRSVENCYYLSSSGGNISGESVDVAIDCGGESNTYSAVSVLYGGILSCDDALKCVIEHDENLFKSMTENNIFCGEIFIRLLYDEGCYYYVGVCDRNKKINAYLVDGERGRIIATKELNG